MQNNNRKILFDSLVSKTKIYLVVIFILLVIICILNYNMIFPALIIYALILIYTYLTNNKRKSEISQHLQELTLNVNATAKNSLIHSPFPLIIIETDGNIIWRSTKFVSEFANVDIEIYIKELLDVINKDIEEMEQKKEKSIKQEIKIGNNDYKVLGELSSSNKDESKKSEIFIPSP